jgi:hypothetical protein
MKRKVMVSGRNRSFVHAKLNKSNCVLQNETATICWHRTTRGLLRTQSTLPFFHFTVKSSMAYEALSNDSKLVNYSRYDESIVPHVMQVGTAFLLAIAAALWAICQNGS